MNTATAPSLSATTIDRADQADKMDEYGMYPALSVSAKMQTTDKKPFTVDSENAANWVLAKIAAVEDEARRIKAQTAQRLAELKSDAARLHFRFDAELEAFARDEAARRRRKTVTLAQGTLALRHQPARFVVTDAGEAERHAEAHKDQFADAFTIRFDADAYKRIATQTATDTGELLPGVIVEEARGVFTIRTTATTTTSAAQMDVVTD